MLRRITALAAVAIAATLLVSCSKSEPEPIPKPAGIDLGAAAEVGDNGNGLWILDGVTAAGNVIDAMRSAGGGTMNASVHELIPVENGDPKPGRTISVSSMSDGSNLRASLVVGNQTGELVVIGQQVWVKGNAAFAERIGVSVETNAFVCMARGPAAITELTTLAEPADFVRSALAGLEIGVLSPTEATPDQQTLVLGTSGAPIGELLVAAHDAPLPQQLYVSDQSGSIEADFTWGDVAEIQPPDETAAPCS